MTLGERIAQLRRAAGLSQEGLAERIGVSRQAVGKWEKGLSCPDTENLLALAKLFGVSADELAGLRGETARAETSAGTPEPEAAGPSRRRIWPRALPVLLAALVLAAAPWVWLTPSLRHKWNARGPEGTGTPPAVQEGTEEPQRPTAQDIGDFALIWQGAEGREFLRVGEQAASFPFGTSLTPSELETVTDTDFRALKLHQVSCGALHLRYTVNSAEDTSYVTEIRTITPDYKTARDIWVGRSEASVLEEYGDELVFCMRDSGDVLCQHEYYYAYAPEDAFGTAVLFYMNFGQVAGITVRAGDDMGNEAFQVDYTNIFPVVNGKVDFTGREEPEEEIAETTKSVYVALSALLTDRNLPAEEEYRHRQAVYEGLPLLDWPAFAALGPAGQDTETMQSLLQYLESQTVLSAHEISCLQGGAFRVDGWYATWYTILLGRAFVAAPEQYVRCMADAGRLYGEDQALSVYTASGCEEGQILEEAEEAIRELLYRSGALRTWQEELCAREIYEKIQEMMGTNS